MEGISHILQRKVLICWWSLYMDLDVYKRQRLYNIRQDKISEENVYQFLLFFDKLYDKFTDLEKKTFLRSCLLYTSSMQENVLTRKAALEERWISLHRRWIERLTQLFLRDVYKRQLHTITFLERCRFTGV